MDWESVKEFILQWAWVPMSGIYIGVIITILSENRNPSKSLAYILVIVFLPVIGLVIYYFVGKKPIFKKGQFTRKRELDRRKMQQYMQQLRPQMEEHLQWLQTNIGDLSFPFRYLYNLEQSLISTGNAVTLLHNGEEKFPALFKALEAARSHIHLEYYMLTADDIGHQITDILIRKSQAGIEVRVIIDDVGSDQVKPLLKRLREANVPFLKFMPVAFNSLANSNYRNHRKIAIIDGEIGFIGGINLDDRYLNNGKHRLYWRDTSVCIKGPAVNLLQAQFFLSWFFAGGEDDYNEQNQYFNFDAPKQGDAIVAIAASGPQSEIPYILETVLLAISQAKESIRITTPYFIPDEPMLSALNIAAANGVTVELIIPAKSDSFIVQHASFSFIKPLLKRGVKVYLYKKGFVHAKTISIDSRLTFVGTANMDIRSFFINFEITAVIHEEDLCKLSEAQFEDDKKSCRSVTLKSWKSRTVMRRGLDSVCRLVAPLL